MDQIKRKNLTKKKISDTLHEKIGHSQIFLEKFIDNVFEIVAHSLLSHQ
jgi:nucleoid DNA-binding protein